MGLVATLHSIEKAGPEQLKRHDANRPMVMDGSLSELVTQALNLAYTKRNMTTGEPYYGHQNATGNPPPGGGPNPDVLNPDTPRQDPQIVKPSLEHMQQMQEQENIVAAAALLEDVLSADDDQGKGQLQEDPTLVYVIPEDGKVTEEMGSQITAMGDSGAVDPHDFVFIYTDKADTVGDYSEGARFTDMNQKVVDYEKKGSRVYRSLESFFADIENIRRK